ncbi:unnamed protein product [Lampetra planeri]
MLDAYNDEDLFKTTNRLRRELVEALQGNLIPILNELSSKEIITPAERGEVSAKTVLGGEAAASHLLDIIIDRKGNRKAKPFWKALWDTRDTYARVMDIFENLSHG